MRQREKAFLAALRRPTQRRYEVEESLDELKRLAESAGADVVGRVTQERRAPTAALYFGKGKVEEIKTLSRREHADLMISDDALSPIQERNLGGSLGLQVIDRTALILDIFAQRARTMEGKLQVELAQLCICCRASSGSGSISSGWAAASHTRARRDADRVRPAHHPPPHPQGHRGAQARARAPAPPPRPAQGKRRAGGGPGRLHQCGQDDAAESSDGLVADGRGPALRDPRPGGAAGFPERSRSPSS